MKFQTITPWLAALLCGITTTNCAQPVAFDDDTTAAETPALTPQEHVDFDLDHSPSAGATCDGDFSRIESATVYTSIDKSEAALFRRGTATLFAQWSVSPACMASVNATIADVPNADQSFDVRQPADFDDSLAFLVYEETCGAQQQTWNSASGRLDVSIDSEGKPTISLKNVVLMAPEDPNDNFVIRGTIRGLSFSTS